MKKITKYRVVIGSTMIVVFVSIIVAIYSNRNEENQENKNISIGVSIYKTNDSFVSDIISRMEILSKIYEQEEGVKINLDISSAKESQRIQNQQIERYISLDYDVICVNIVDRTDTSSIIDTAIDADIPLVFFNREPVAEDIYKGEDIYYVGADTEETAALQAQIIEDIYEQTPEKLDKNGDNILQYAMLEGELGHQDAIIRTEVVIQNLIDKGIAVEKVKSGVANWERNQAAAIVEQWIEDTPLGIEIFICNNDDMALGVLDVLAENEISDIAIVGVDAVKAGIEAVKDGLMIGTVDCNSRKQGETILKIAMALALEEEIDGSIPLEHERFARVKLNKIVAKP